MTPAAIVISLLFSLLLIVIGIQSKRKEKNKPVRESQLKPLDVDAPVSDNNVIRTRTAVDPVSPMSGYHYMLQVKECPKCHEPINSHCEDRNPRMVYLQCPKCKNVIEY